MKHQSHVTSTESSLSHNSSGNTDGLSAFVATRVPSRTTGVPRRGILKVRFAGDVDQTCEVEVISSQEVPSAFNPQPSPSTARFEGNALLLPQPPPGPPPLRPSHLGPPPPPDGPLPPSLFEPAINDNPYLSGPAYRLYTKFFKGLSQFVEHQAQLLRNRLSVQERRVELRRLREEVSQSDVKFMNHVRKSVTEGSPSSHEDLTQLFEEALSTRDRYGPFEAEFELMEVKLGAEEDALSRKFSELETRYQHFFSLKEGSTTGSEPSEIDYEDSSTASEAEEESHLPIPTDLLFGTIIGEEVPIGQLPIFPHKGRPKLVRPSADVIQDHKRISQQSDVGGSALEHQNTESEDSKAQEENPEDLLGMSGAGDVGIAHATELDLSGFKISSEESLKDLLGQHLFDDIIDPGPFPEEIDADPNLEEVGMLLLFEDDADTISNLHDYLMDFYSTPERVNKWMLHQLRLSRREAFALRRVMQQSEVDKPGWPETSVRIWFSDGLDYVSSYIQGSITDESASLNNESV